MRTPFAWRNIVHRKARAAVALSGVAFSVLLVFMQTGFYGAIIASAGSLFRAMNADIFLVSPNYLSLGQTGTIPRERIAQARGVDGVMSATWLFVDTQLWRNHQTSLRNPMMVLGIDPASNPLRVDSTLAGQLSNGTILVDELTRPRYGHTEAGTVTELGDIQVEVAGRYRIGSGFIADGACITDDETFLRIFPARRPGNPTLGLLRLQPGANLPSTLQRLRALLPSDVQILTHDEMIQTEETYWAVYTSIGPVFGLATVLGFVIGAVILYQVMVTDMANHVAEYATLKALGYSQSRLRWLVLQEVSIFSAMGFVVGLLLSTQLYRIVRDGTGLPLTLSIERATSVFLMTLAMSWLAGLLSTRQLAKADPADLY